MKPKSALESGEDVLAIPPPLTERPPLDRFCDLVLTGGVASGVVYPWAILEIARAFRFRNIGGTSVGAIAACLAAAAEYGRRTGFEYGFEVLRQAPGDLAATDDSKRTRMLRLFQPSPDGRRLFDLFVEGVRQVERVRRPPAGRWFRLACAFANAYRAELLGGAATGAGVALLLGVGIGAGLAFVLGLPGGQWWPTSGPSAVDGVLGAGTIVGLAGGAVIGATLSVLRALRSDVVRGVVANDLGLCRGGPTAGHDPTDDPGLVQWLHDGIRRAAGLAEDDPPLTFRDLWCAPLAPGVAAAPDAVRRRAARSINLEVITTNVTHGRPYRLPGPDPTSRLFFRADELVPFFPPHVLRALVAAARPYAPRNDSDPPCSAQTEGFLELPDADLPIVVAARLSLSFPILFSAVPLYAIDYEIEKPRDRTLRRCWFSDGGICSNFPIHLFDAPIPRWPTFGLWLGKRSPHRRKQPVWMPDLQREGWGDRLQRFDPEDPKTPRYTGEARQPGDIGFLAGFLGAILTAAKDWQDHTAMRMPQVRNRVARLQLRPGEGELNIAMSRSRILRMAHTYGAQAGRLVRQRWSAEPGDPVPTAWREQRWVRLHTLVEGLRDFVRGTAAGDAHTAHSVSLDQALRDARVDGGGDAPLRDPNSDTHLTASQAEALGRLRDALRDLETTFANDLEPQPFRPEPRPELKLRPPV